MQIVRFKGVHQQFLGTMLRLLQIFHTNYQNVHLVVIVIMVRALANVKKVLREELVKGCLALMVVVATERAFL